MDFGKVEPEEMARIDFALPPDHAFTRRTLPGGPVAAPQVFVGCPIWASKEWAGKVYPPGVKEKEYLKHYARQFNTIELNTTHYRIPDPGTIEKWKLAAAAGFQFCPKIPQVISHDCALVDAEALTQAFCLSIAGLGERLGVAFLQLPPSFGPANGPTLAAYLRQFPGSIPLAVEFRHPDWFNQPAVWHQTLEMLHDHGVSTVITDVAGRRDVLHQSLTTPVAFVRYVGNMRQPADYSRLDAWVQRLKSWLENGLERIYFFVHEYDNLISPEVCRYLIRALNQHCGLQMAEPRLLAQVVQGSLF